MIDGPFRGFAELPTTVIGALRECVEVAVRAELDRSVAPVVHRPSPLTEALNSDSFMKVVTAFAPKARRTLVVGMVLEQMYSIDVWCGCGRRASVEFTELALMDAIDPVFVIARLLERIGRQLNCCHCVPLEQP